MTGVLGKPHIELIERTGHRETLIGRYETRETAEAEKEFRERLYSKMRITHGEFILRPREF